MTSDIPLERMRAAVPIAVSLIAAIENAPVDGRRGLDLALQAALASGDTEALLLTFANMSHALVSTLSRKTGASVPDLLASLGQVTGPPNG